MSCLIKYNYQYVYIDSESKMKLGSKVRAKVFDDQKAKNLIKNPPKNMRLYKLGLKSYIAVMELKRKLESEWNISIRN